VKKTSKFLGGLPIVLVVILLLGMGGCVFKQAEITTNPLPLPKLTQENISVVAGGQEISHISLNEGEILKVNFKVQGGWGNDIDFTLKDPNGKVLFNTLKISEDFGRSFIAEVSGDYQLIFGNRFSLISTKKVQLSKVVFSKQ
jgi:hypothetical protein